MSWDTARAGHGLAVPEDASRFALLDRCPNRYPALFLRFSGLGKYSVSKVLAKQKSRWDGKSLKQTV